jgi:hypothetical protein
MTESEGGIETTRISRRKAIKLGALGAAGGAAAWLLPGTAGAGRSLTPPGICARGSGDICGRQVRQCGISKPGGIPNGELCVCASDSRTPAVHCVEDRIDEGFLKCSTKADCAPGMLCVKRCVDFSLDSDGPVGGTRPQGAKRQQFEVIMSICAWPCNQGPPAGED